MDPVAAAGIALSVIGLVPLCVAGFEMIENCVKAPKDAAEEFAFIKLQTGTFIAWTEEWRIDWQTDQQPSSTVARRQSLLQEHIKSGTKTGPHIVAALVSITNNFRSIRELEREYGIEIESPDKDLTEFPKLDASKIINGELKPDSSEMQKRKKSMNILRRCKYALRDTKGLKGLGTNLERNIGALLKMCSGHKAWRIEMTTLVRAVGSYNTTPELESLAKVAEQRGRAIDDLFRYTALFKAKLQLLDPNKSDIYHDQKFFRYDVYSWEFNDGEGTLAVSNRSNSVRYIEWKSYSMNNGGDGRDSENDIKMLALLLASSFKPTEICTRKCLGVFKDPLNERYGIIYQPPTYIEDFWTVNTQDSAVARFCKPVTLLGLIEKSADPRRSASILDLGIRFQLAKQLAQSVLILHAAGWVHKNIRSTSVMFLPAQSEMGGPSRNYHLDYDNPWLCGFGRSRPEDPEDLSSHRQRAKSRTTTGRAQVVEIASDIYQHPEKRYNPMIKYLPAFDIYSLGCVLLEIGLWQSLKSFYPKKVRCSQEQFRDILLDATEDLVGQTGSRYASAVKECLKMTSKYSDQEAQDVLCRKVVSVLEGCSA